MLESMLSPPGTTSCGAFKCDLHPSPLLTAKRAVRPRSKGTCSLKPAATPLSSFDEQPKKELFAPLSRSQAAALRRSQSTCGGEKACWDAPDHRYETLWLLHKRGAAGCQRSRLMCLLRGSHGKPERRLHKHRQRACEISSVARS